MPVLSKFCGIVIRMLFAPVLGAHFHAIYGEHELVVAISPLGVIQGDAPPAIRDLVLRWAGQHRRDLMDAWQRCAAGLQPQRIAPLGGSLA
jgi:hypothetical protein